MTSTTAPSVASAPKQKLIDLFAVALEAANPASRLAQYLPEPPQNGRTLVIGAGKAAASMAVAFEEHWPGQVSGTVVTRYGHGRRSNCIEVFEAGHPLPDAASVEAARKILTLAQSAQKEDLVVCLLSGGGSALLSLPAAGLSLEDQRRATEQLLASGARVQEINCVRKHMSAITGGRLAIAAFPATIATLAISDVVGDDPAAIASGPTVPDNSTLQEAIQILNRYRVGFDVDLAQRLADPCYETPKPNDPRFRDSDFRIIARGSDALDAAAALARNFGYEVINLGDHIDGGARDVAVEHAALARQARADARRVCILSGGETTVKVTGSGRGGRNTEFLLSLALALDEIDGIYAIACDTDGIDGTQDNAGAIVTPQTLSHARSLGLDAELYGRKNDAYGFFAALDDLIVTGPTGTNVNDFRAILVG